MSRIERDAEADTAYVYVADAIGDGEAVHQTRVEPPNSGAEIILDFDAQGMLLGVEILGASRVLRADPRGGQE